GGPHYPGRKAPDRNRSLRATGRHPCSSPRAIQTRLLRDCARRFFPCRRAPASGRRSFRGNALRRLPPSGVFFTVPPLLAQTGNPVGEADELLGQFLEAPVVFDVFLYLGGAIRRNALGELFTFQVALQDIIRPPLVVLTSRLILEELAAKRATTHPIQ